MFRRLLIANRGEVAVRIARAARELGIVPVGVASAADLGASWTEVMDEVVCIGPAAAARSYLVAERLVQAALQTQCSALHPGWGFLAEDPRLAQLCQQHGICFVGPRASVIALLGKKTPARRGMRAAGLQVVPAQQGEFAFTLCGQRPARYLYLTGIRALQPGCDLQQGAFAIATGTE
jgi:acetyl-CoA carboxylase biotin carboxylase subunit